MKIANLISFITHPWLMPLLGIFLLFQTGSWISLLPPEAKKYVYLVTITCTIILPLLTAILLKNRGLLSSVFKPRDKERRIPLMMVSFFILLAAFILQKVSAPMIFSLFLNGLSITILIAALISGFWKISTHMLGLGAIFGLVLAVSLKWMIDLRLVLSIVSILIGVSATARLRLQEHNPAQICCGLLLGFLPLFILIRFV